MLRKQGFTLIELLVVIAIIAILASILFPVFAQAKMAAKKTASLSNVKQLGTAALLYGNDYDDWTMRANSLPGHRYPDRLIEYVKNWNVFLSPVKTYDPSNFRDPNNKFIYDYALRVWPEYGYNNRFLAENPPCPKPGMAAPLCRDAGRGGGHAMAEVQEPANTVQFVSSTFGYPGPDAPNTPMLGSWRVDPPGWWRPQDGPLPNNPSYYGMNWPRYNGTFVVEFLDGHVKALNVGKLSDERIWDLE